LHWARGFERNESNCTVVVHSDGAERYVEVDDSVLVELPDLLEQRLDNPLHATFIARLNEEIAPAVLPRQ
tara:strand:+ start:816 stop:1025 length:210 start_codon:yes stop_codon:yes gene_type:complete